MLAFLMNDDASVAPTFQESEIDRIKKLKDFRTEVCEHRTVDWWSNPDELAGKVIAALTRQMARKPRTGWVRASEFDIEKSHAEFLELAEKVRALEEENATLREKTGDKREPKLVIETLSPVVISTTDPESIPDLKSWYRKFGKEDAEQLNIQCH